MNRTPKFLPEEPKTTHYYDLQKVFITLPQPPAPTTMIFKYLFSFEDFFTEKIKRKNDSKKLIVADFLDLSAAAFDSCLRITFWWKSKILLVSRGGVISDW